MNPTAFVNALSELQLDNVFNPYADKCPVHDRSDAVAARRRNLRGYLKAATDIGVDTIWMDEISAIAAGGGLGLRSPMNFTCRK
jgi:hypothetical protein